MKQKRIVYRTWFLLANTEHTMRASQMFRMLGIFVKTFNRFLILF